MLHLSAAEIGNDRIVFNQLASHCVSSARWARLVVRMAETWRHPRRSLGGLSPEAYQAKLSNFVDDWVQMMQSVGLSERIHRLNAETQTIFERRRVSMRAACW